MAKANPKPAVTENEAALVAETLAAMKTTGMNMEKILALIASYRQELGLAKTIFEKMRPHVAPSAQADFYPLTEYGKRDPTMALDAITLMMEHIDKRLKG